MAAERYRRPPMPRRRPCRRRPPPKITNGRASFVLPPVVNPLGAPWGLVSVSIAPVEEITSIPTVAGLARIAASAIAYQEPSLADLAAAAVPVHAPPLDRKVPAPVPPEMSVTVKHVPLADMRAAPQWDASAAATLTA